MSIIFVEGKLLGVELVVWGVLYNYVVVFVEKSVSKNGCIVLYLFFFNDIEYMINQCYWLVINVVFWCCVYCEVESKEVQIEVLVGICVIFYIVGVLGVGEIKVLIQEWWWIIYEFYFILVLNYLVVII